MKNPASKISLSFTSLIVKIEKGWTPKRTQNFQKSLKGKPTLSSKSRKSFSLGKVSSNLKKKLD